MTEEEMNQEAPEEELRQAEIEYMKKFNTIVKVESTSVEWLLMLKLAVRRGKPLTDMEINDVIGSEGVLN